METLTLTADTPVLVINPRGFANEWSARPILAEYLDRLTAFAAHRDGVDGCTATISRLGDLPQNERHAALQWSDEDRKTLSYSYQSDGLL